MPKRARAAVAHRRLRARTGEIGLAAATTSRANAAAAGLNALGRQRAITSAVACIPPIY